MAFSESVKTIARKKAHFRCAICRETPLVEVHHIIPESDGGSDELENAAPLCPSCHDTYGNNPDKRKQIRQMRDQWYEICEKRYKDPEVAFYVERTDQIYEMTKNIEAEGTKNTEILYGIQSSLLGLIKHAGDSIEKAKTLDEVGTTSGYLGAATTLIANVHANFRCAYCGTQIGLLIGTNNCPNCGKSIGR